MDRRVGEVGVALALAGVLQQVGECRQDQTAVEAQLVEEHQAMGRVAEPGEAIDRCAGHLSQGQTLGVLAGVEDCVCPGRRNPLDGRVGHVLGQPVLTSRR